MGRHVIRTSENKPIQVELDGQAAALPIAKTATAASGAATLNNSWVSNITSESLTTAAAASYTLTLTDNSIGAGSVVLPSVSLGTSTTGVPQIVDVAVTAGQVVIIVKNIHASAAFNGTIVIGVVVF